MKRIDIEYGGRQYSVGGRDLDDVLAEIEAALSQSPGWVNVNDGEGERRDALLMITPGVPLAVIPVPVHGAHDRDGDAAERLGATPLE